MKSIIIVDVEPNFWSDFENLPKEIKKKFKKQFKFLKENPQHPSLKIHKIQGTDYWELYVDKFYRCVFTKEGSLYRLYCIGTHDVLNKLEGL